ncbi:MAG: hypothetical protein H0V66_09320 [Bdellovibrionales bacterium]|nr:hypothetical protein [Bdellovibrionales bacterium]
MDNRQLSHDILNILERLRIMHDLIKDKNYEHIPKDELLTDLNENLEALKKKFDILAQ